MKSIDFILLGRLFDPDNYLYLVQAIDLLNGQSWFDHIQHRMNPPEGTYIHYSNFLVGIYAAFIYILLPFLDSFYAALATSIIVPPLFFLAFLFVLRWIARTFVDKDLGDVTAYFAILSPAVFSRFLAGHVDHHGIVAVLVLIAYGAMLYSCCRSSARVSIVGGLALAFSLVLALETVSFALLFSICLGTKAMIDGGDAAHCGVAYSLSLFLGSALLLLGVRAPAHLFDVDLLAYSVIYVILTANIAFCFAGVALAKHRPVRVRLFIGATLFVLTAGVFFFFFPELVHGPYGGVDPGVKKIIFSTASEAWPSFSQNFGFQRFANLFFYIAALTANGILLARAASRDERWLWGISFVVLGSSITLAGFYQIRFNIYVYTFSIFPLIAQFKKCWEASLASGSQKGFWAAIFCLPVIFFLSAFSPKNDEARQAMNDFKPTEEGCDMRALAATLNDPLGYGRTPRIIINSLNEGAELLLRTPHSVLSAPYHMNVSGNLDVQRFFLARDPEEAKKIAHQRNASFVVLCRFPQQLKPYEGINGDEKGKVFVDRLISGDIPAWLKPVRATAFGDNLLFEIDLSLEHDEIKREHNPS
ncbi:MAG: hypothetical protein PHW76_10005 [Alphaproteobacteria bacterium]|nr:hypothetical protein [Alphaproteobacteria bacterium]